MRFSKLPLSPASLAATTVLAATLGASTSLWTSEQDRVLACMPIMVEEMTVTAQPFEDSPVAVSLEPERSAYAVGEPVVLQASIRNVSDGPVAVTDAGIFELTVQRTSSPMPMGLGDVMFMALAESGAAGPLVLAPGEVATRRVQVGADEPFDVPGLYRVTGSWVGEHAADLTAFEVRIEDAAAVAQKDGARRNPGA